MQEHHGCVNSISLNDAETLLVSGSDDHVANIYGVQSGNYRHIHVCELMMMMRTMAMMMVMKMMMMTIRMMQF